MQGKTVVLGVGGGIAAYKSCELASQLTQRGAKVLAVLTASAQRFVTPLTFQALTQHPVHTSLWPSSHDNEAGVAASMAHIRLAGEADAILIAPASANVIARLAHGLADDLLTTLVLASRAPVLVAPAMNPAMLSHPATQKNLATLRELGYTIIEPESGRMACEHVGRGRLPATEVLLAHLENVFNVAPRDLAGQKILVTAGPTREPLDPVRYLSNRSSGRMGYAIAEIAAQRGAEVLLISGPCALSVPRDVTRVDVQTTQEMFDAVTQHAPDQNVIIAAAAPADFAPVKAAPQKIKKSAATKMLPLELAPTPDIIATVARDKKPHQIVIGFAAETQKVLSHAQQKLRAKNLDAIVANDVTQPDAGFDVSTNRVLWITESGAEEWPLLDKREVAARICDRVTQMLARE